MRSTRSIRWAMLLGFSLLTGCVACPRRDDLAPAPVEPPVSAAEAYTLACPDILEIIFLDWPEVSQTFKVEADGCINLGQLGRPRVEGETAAEAARRIAERAQISEHRVRVQVVEFNSRQVLVYSGPPGTARIVDYRGPETVRELLQRVGALKQDATPKELHVVRARVGEGIPAEVLTVDLQSMAQKPDDRTNLRVQPLDAIYLGEMPRERKRKPLAAILKTRFLSSEF